jgi:transposase
MLIIGCDYRPSFQQIAFVDTESGELKEQRLAHREAAEEFYRALAATGQRVRVGMEASGHARWFERLLAELQFELCMGDASEIRRKRGRKQKTDRQDALHILDLLLKNDFPPIWVPSWENRDLRQLLWHRQSHGADAHPDHESTASRGAERRFAVQEEVVAGTGTPATGSVPVSALGQPASARSAGVAGSTGPNDC